jgi:hypothetical protein
MIQTAATIAKRHTRKQVSTATATTQAGINSYELARGTHEGEMEAAQQQRGAADGANNIGEIFYVSRAIWNTSSKQGRGVSTQQAKQTMHSLIHYVQAAAGEQ